MRRIVFVVVLAAALVFAAFAAARTSQYTGAQVGGPGTFNFRATFKHGKPVRINGSSSPPNGKGFTWAGVPMSCADGAQSTSAHLTFPMPVGNGKFHGLGVNQAPAGRPFSKAEVAGKFKQNGDKVTGTLRMHGRKVTGDDLSAHHHCDTGKVRYVAKR